MSPVRLHRHPRAGRTRAAQAPASLQEQVDGVLRDVALLVSARGLCARAAAQLAGLPLLDLDAVGAACQCTSCRTHRLH